MAAAAPLGVQTAGMTQEQLSQLASHAAAAHAANAGRCSSLLGRLPRLPRQVQSCTWLTRAVDRGVREVMQWFYPHLSETTHLANVNNTKLAFLT